MIRKSLLPVVLLTFINTLGFSLLIPVLPFVVKQYGMGEITYGILLSSFFIFQFLGAPILGSLSDKYGRKPLLIISQFGTFIGWGIFAVAWFLPNIPLWGIPLPIIIIMLSRMVDGVTGGNISVANAYLSDITEPEERVHVFGMMGAVLGIGMIVGPALGSFSNATSLGYLGTMIVAMIISLGTLVLLHLFLKESLPPEERAHDLEFHFGKQINIWEKIRAYKSDHTLQSIFLIRIFFALAMSSYTSIIVFYMVEHFGFDEKQIGFFMLFVGTFVIFNQAVLVKRVVKLLGDMKMLIVGQICMMCGLFVVHVADSLWLFVILYYFVNLGLSLSIPALKGILTKSVPKNKLGEISGIDESLGSIAFAIAPTFAGYMYFLFQGYAFPIFGLLLAISLIIVGVRLKIRMSS